MQWRHNSSRIHIHTAGLHSFVESGKLTLLFGMQTCLLQNIRLVQLERHATSSRDIYCVVLTPWLLHRVLTTMHSSSRGVENRGCQTTKEQHNIMCALCVMAIVPRSDTSSLWELLLKLAET